MVMINEQQMHYLNCLRKYARTYLYKWIETNYGHLTVFRGCETLWICPFKSITLFWANNISIEETLCIPMVRGSSWSTTSMKKKNIGHIYWYIVEHTTNFYLSVIYWIHFLIFQIFFFFSDYWTLALSFRNYEYNTSASNREWHDFRQK